MELFYFFSSSEQKFHSRYGFQNIPELFRCFERIDHPGDMECTITSPRGTVSRNHFNLYAAACRRLPDLLCGFCRLRRREKKPVLPETRKGDFFLFQHSGTHSFFPQYGEMARSFSMIGGSFSATKSHSSFVL